jgi:hypothetical protein
LLRTEALAAPAARPGRRATARPPSTGNSRRSRKRPGTSSDSCAPGWQTSSRRQKPDADKLGEGGGSEGGGEAEALLAELADPKTPPPRRLAIGDRLAEIGDPRRGVGVREFVLARCGAAPSRAGGRNRDRPKSTNSSTNSNASRLIPPRRLAIGDRLAEIGDPRAGVGLDVRGLPALDWVEIPGGEFIYQNGEKRRLPTFRMARYPITNAQYQAFIDAGGYTGQGRKHLVAGPKTIGAGAVVMAAGPTGREPTSTGTKQWLSAAGSARNWATKSGCQARKSGSVRCADATGASIPGARDYRTGYSQY